MGNRMDKRTVVCMNCGRTVQATSPRQKYCIDCRESVYKTTKKDYLRARYYREKAQDEMSKAEVARKKKKTIEPVVNGETLSFDTFVTVLAKEKMSYADWQKQRTMNLLKEGKL